MQPMPRPIVQNQLPFHDVCTIVDGGYYDIVLPINATDDGARIHIPRIVSMPLKFSVSYWDCAKRLYPRPRRRRHAGLKEAAALDGI